ncbi:hypothetical protein C8R47DRAFT_300750 [Mycena vitilis]|nr:hypothetical protein C8R47DRAFT_300750 [Mycena vitilis]
MIRCGTQSITMSQETVLDELFTALSQTRQSNCVLVAAVTFLAFDICTSFDQEVKYIWKERWSLPKVLYLFCRYYGLLDLLFVLVVATHEEVSVKLPHLLWRLRLRTRHARHDGRHTVHPADPRSLQPELENACMPPIRKI